MYGMGCGTGLWEGLLTIVVVTLAIWAVVTILNNNRSQGSRHFENLPVQYDRPLEILRRRFARGEISKEEFEQMKRDSET